MLEQKELEEVNVDKIYLSEEYSRIEFGKKYRDILYDDYKNPSLKLSIKNLYAPFKPQKFNSEYNYFWLIKLNKKDANKLLEIEKKSVIFSVMKNSLHF